MTAKTLSVSAIENGCVIDHIPAGQVSKILQALKLTGTGYQMTVGLNLKSKSSGRKDIVKIEGRRFTEQELQQIAIFAAGATVNEIEHFKVVKKFKLELPKQVINIIRCPNDNCISNLEPVKSLFTIEPDGKAIKFHCNYCEGAFAKGTIESML